MNNYERILILHALDDSTSFLERFKEELSDFYVSFTSNKESIQQAKETLGDLEEPSLIVFLGHGSSSGLFEPDDNHKYDKFFLDITWGNLYFNEHDVLLLSCNSKDLINKIHKPFHSIGFGNIISSPRELEIYNNKHKIEKTLSKEEIDIFNNIYLDSSIKVVKSIIRNEITFMDIPKRFRFYINKEIDKILLDKKNSNRIELARILFEFRNEITFRQN